MTTTRRNFENLRVWLIFLCSFWLYVVLFLYAPLSAGDFAFCVIGLNILWLLGVNPLVVRGSLFGRQFSLLFVFAVVIRVACLFVSPVFEDDFYRYLWDGYVIAEGFNPYVYSPSAFFGKEIPGEMEFVLDRVSYPDVATVYGGVAQYLFALCYWIMPGSIWPLKILVFTAELGLLLLLAQCVDRKRFYLYAFCPLIIHCFAINLHIDIIAILFVVIAMLNSGWKRMVCLAVSISIKPFAIILLPFVIRDLIRQADARQKYGTTCRSLALFAVAYLLLEWPFLITGRNSLPNVLAVAEYWAFNNPIYYQLLFVFEARVVRIGLSLALLLSLGWLLLNAKYRNVLHCAFPAFVMFVICSPVVNAWYFAWPLVFSLFQQMRAWPWVAAVTLWLSYCNGMNLNPGELGLYEIHSWIMWIEWGVPALVALFTFILPWMSRIKLQ